MSAVALRAVTKRYGSLAALDAVSLLIPDGSFFALLGPSGSGKTTLLRAIAGFVEPDAGQILIDGADLAHIPAHRRHIGMVFQNYALFPHMSVFDNVAFALAVRGQARAAIRRRVADMLDLVRLEGLEERRPRQLSGGQQQRVALARALAAEPRVLLLDEPLGALDKRLRQEMQIELKRIQRAVGTTAVFVTHDQEEALTLSDRIAIVDRGALVQVGAPDEVYERPANRFAASFLGDANFLAGSVRGDAVAVAGLGPVRTASPLAGPQATLAVRPEKMRLAAPDEAPAGANRAAGRIAQRVFSGASVTYVVETAAGPLRVFQRNGGEAMAEEGAAVAVLWSPQHSVAVAE